MIPGSHCHSEMFDENCTYYKTPMLSYSLEYVALISKNVNIISLTCARLYRTAFILLVIFLYFTATVIHGKYMDQKNPL